ncbi:hypothetical protein EDB87DRAFT_1577485 [Lactarius vividus]|nr:hypothetical protein EDB87DRAFT_1577485 [Lactarius vividus]
MSVKSHWRFEYTNLLPQILPWVLLDFPVQCKQKKKVLREATGTGIGGRAQMCAHQCLISVRRENPRGREEVNSVRDTYLRRSIILGASNMRTTLKVRPVFTREMRIAVIEPGYDEGRARAQARLQVVLSSSPHSKILSADVQFAKNRLRSKVQSMFLDGRELESVMPRAADLERGRIKKEGPGQALGDLESVDVGTWIGGHYKGCLWETGTQGPSDTVAAYLQNPEGSEGSVGVTEAVRLSRNCYDFFTPGRYKDTIWVTSGPKLAKLCTRPLTRPMWRYYGIWVPDNGKSRLLNHIATSRFGEVYHSNFDRGRAGNCRDVYHRHYLGLMCSWQVLQVPRVDTPLRENITGQRHIHLVTGLPSGDAVHLGWPQTKRWN